VPDVPAEVVAQLDEALVRMGVKSRMQPIRRALHAFLGDAGEEHVATLLAGAEPADNK